MDHLFIYQDRVAHTGLSIFSSPKMRKSPNNLTGNSTSGAIRTDVLVAAMILRMLSIDLTLILNFPNLNIRQVYSFLIVFL